MEGVPPLRHGPGITSAAAWGVAGVLALGLGLGWLMHRARSLHPEIALPDGTVLVVEGLTHGPRQALQREPEVWTALKKVLPPRAQHVIGPPRPPRMVVQHDESALLWLSRWSASDGKYLDVGHDLLKVQAVMPDGTQYEAGGSMNWGQGERGNHAKSMGVLDWRSDTLRFRVVQGSWKAEFTMPNPRAGERFETWQPRPLPHTNVVKGFTFILHGMHNHGASNEPLWMPQWEITQEGRSAAKWFSTHWTFHDPTGNRGWRGLPASEPTWKVRVMAQPSADFPFQPDQLLPLGRIDVPGPGQYRVLEPRSDWTNAGLHAVVMTGPGNFTFVDGRNTLASAPDPSGSGENSSSLGSHGWTFTSSSRSPMLHLLLRGSPDTGLLVPGPGKARFILRARRPDGSTARWREDHNSVAEHGLQRSVYMAHGLDATEPSPAFDLDLAMAEPITADWTLASPYRR